jgi:hypothetical protein
MKRLSTVLPEQLELAWVARWLGEAEVLEGGRPLRTRPHRSPAGFAFLFFLTLQLRKAPDVLILKRSNAGLIRRKAACNPFRGGKNFSALQHINISLLDT